MRICKGKDPNPETQFKLINYYVEANNPAIMAEDIIMQKEDLPEENKPNCLCWPD
jgi:hypothetical protein